MVRPCLNELSLLVFNRDQAKISAYGQSSADAMSEVLRFVILTIRTPLYRIPGDMEAIAQGEREQEIAWGFKAEALTLLEEQKASIYWQAQEIAYHAENNIDLFRDLLRFFSGLVGFGPAKAGFACQLLYGVGACLDTHNLTRFGIAPSAVKASSYKRLKTRVKREKWLTRYIDICARIGTCEHFWDSWCIYLAKAKPNTYSDPDHVSRLHCEALGLG